MKSINDEIRRLEIDFHKLSIDEDMQGRLKALKEVRELIENAGTRIDEYGGDDYVNKNEILGESDYPLQ